MRLSLSAGMSFGRFFPSSKSERRKERHRKKLNLDIDFSMANRALEKNDLRKGGRKLLGPAVCLIASRTNERAKESESQLFSSHHYEDSKLHDQKQMYTTYVLF